MKSETRYYSGVFFILCMAATVLLWSANGISSAVADDAITLDGNAGGPRFDGVGAVSGGGATSVLLKDYPEPQRSQILDLLFKPNFAASMSTLYVEIPGDGNSTQGTEPSHMRSRTDENYSRGYEWWIMAEAKKRNPLITLDACAWSCPEWVGEGNFWSQDMCDYDVKWIQGLKKNYGLDLDSIGCRNERGAVEPFVKMFRRTLNANGLNSVKIHAFDGNGKRKWDWCKDLATDKELQDSVDIIGNHTMSVVPTPESVKGLSRRLNKPIWNTEEHIYDGEGLTYKDEYACAIGEVHQFNDNFIDSGATKIVNWYLVDSIYPIEPYAKQPPAMFADSPWSGHYSIKPIVWGYAHYGQFSKVGWQYLNGACGHLADGGSYVTLKSPEKDYSIIVETSGAGKNQNVTFKTSGGLSAQSLCVWKTNRTEQFVRQADLKPMDGSFTITLEPESIYSISTTTGQQKGSFADVPQAKPFPFPFYENYEEYGDARRWGYLPHYTADICGVFEIANRPDGKGKCLRQVLDRKDQSWAPEWMPYTVLGDAKWSDYEISADIFLDDGGWAGLMGRINSTGNGWDGNPNGYYMRLYPDGGCALYVADQKLHGSRDRQLAIASVPNWKRDQWRNVKLQFRGSSIIGFVDGIEVIRAEDKSFDHGLAGLITGGEGSARNTAMFDDLIINRVDGDKPSPTIFPVENNPIYGQ
jgi:galactosylceramidase